VKAHLLIKVSKPIWLHREVGALTGLIRPIYMYVYIYIYLFIYVFLMPNVNVDI